MQQWDDATTKTTTTTTTTTTCRTTINHRFLKQEQGGHWVELDEDARCVYRTMNDAVLSGNQEVKQLGGTELFDIS
jgi:hypothetical protein